MAAATDLPIPAEQLVPHRPPMRLVDTLLSCGNGAGTAEARPGRECLFADARGVLDPAALVEILAQSYAAVRGYEGLSGGKPPAAGFLVGIRRFEITGAARAGDRLVAEVRTAAAFDRFVVVEGEIRRGGETIASGSMNLFLAGPGTGR